MGWRLICTCVAAVTLVVGGCNQAADAPSDEAASGGGVTPVVAETEVFLCGGCGQVKGTDSCCAEGAEACAKCELAKGSPGCCAIEKGTDAQLCVKCGQLAGTETCCAEGAEKCEKCNLAKGSPGCCNIEI